MTPSSPTSAPLEASLFAAIQEQNSDWKKRLFDSYLSLVRGLLIKTMGPQAEVDDLTMDVFVGLFESAKNIRTSEGLRSYVVSVTMNTARREFRRRRRQRLFFFRDEGGELIERSPGVDDPKAKTALLQLSRILGTFPVEERLVFVLHVLEEQPLHEAAAQLSISLSTAKRRLKKVNERLLRKVSQHSLLAEYVHERAQGASSSEKDGERT